MSILQMENEHRECCSEVQSLRTRLERTQGDLHLKELELEKLEMLQMRRGQYQGDQQVSRILQAFKSSVSLIG